MTCTFFGNRDATTQGTSALRAILLQLIEEGVTQFYVGNQGAFDRIVAKELTQLCKEFPHIGWAIVLAYYPSSPREHDMPTIFPEGLENVPPRFAINKRNAWMIEHADIVVTYTRSAHGGAGMWKENAAKRGKHIIELHEALLL